MKNKFKIIALILILIISVTILTACENKVEVSRKAIDVRFIPMHQETVTTYENKYNPLEGSWQYVPNVHTEVIPDTYEVQYIITYDDGSEEAKWEEVTRPEYEKIKSKLGLN